MNEYVFPTTEDLSLYTDINSGINFRAFRNSIQRALRLYFVPVLGEGFITAMQKLAGNTADAGITLTEEEKAVLLKKFKTALGPLTAFVFIPRGDVMFTEAGIRRAETDTVKTAYRYQVNALLDSHLNDGLDALEQLLAFVDAHASNISYWDSEKKDAYKNLWIKSGSELNTLFNLHRPHLIYRDVRPLMSIVQNHIVVKELGTAYDNLQTQTTQAAPQSEHWLTLRKALAYLTMWQAVNENVVRFDHGAITVLTANASSTDEMEKRSSADYKDAVSYKEHLRNMGYMLLADLKKHFDPPPAPSTTCGEWPRGNPNGNFIM